MGDLFSELKRRNVVRVAIAYVVVGWVIMQIIDVVVEPLHLPDWTATLVLTLLLVGLPVALIFSWAFELTPQGLKKTHEVDADASITPSTGRKLDRMIIGALAIAVAFLVYDRFSATPPEAPATTPTAVTETTAPESAPTEASIAVLPFVNMSSEAEQEFFSDGISEELLNALVKLPNLKVAARTSSFSFKDKNLTVQEIGQILGVEHILEGSVRKSGIRIRVTAQLVRASDGFHLWSETYDRELDDIFAVQDEITRRIIDELRLTLGGTEVPVAKAATTNTEAYQAYLKGRYFWNLRTGPDLLTAIGHFEEATRLDPEYAEAWAGLADTYNVIPSYDINDEKALGRLEKGRQAALRALEINPEMGRAYVSLGSIANSLFRFPEALGYFERGLELAPEYATGWQWYGTFLGEMGRHEEGLKAQERALELDPVSRIINNNYAESLRAAGRTEDAIKHVEYALTLDPDFIFHHLSLTTIHLDAGNFSEARAALRAAAQISEENLDSILAWVNRIEDFATSGQVVDVPPELLSLPFFTRREPALFLILSGHIEAGFDLLEEALAAGYGDAGLYWTFYDHAFRSVWDHPRFKALKTAVGLEEASE